jgi:hypothetical protein
MNFLNKPANPKLRHNIAIAVLALGIFGLVGFEAYTFLAHPRQTGSVLGVVVCGENEHKNSPTDRTCSCDTGYVRSGTVCVTQNSQCIAKYGLNSIYNTLKSACTCLSGYRLNAKKTACIRADLACSEELGSNSFYISSTDSCLRCPVGQALVDAVCLPIVKPEPVALPAATVPAQTPVAVTPVAVPSPKPAETTNLAAKPTASTTKRVCKIYCSATQKACGNGCISNKIPCKKQIGTACPYSLWKK